VSLPGLYSDCGKNQIPCSFTVSFLLFPLILLELLAKSRDSEYLLLFFGVSCSFPQPKEKFADFGQNSTILEAAAKNSPYFSLFSGNVAAGLARLDPLSSAIVRWGTRIDRPAIAGGTDLYS
jgi:hypothetical protein